MQRQLKITLNQGLDFEPSSVAIARRQESDNADKINWHFI